MKISDYIIDDGYTQDGYIAEKPRVYGKLLFKFRPMIQADKEAYVQAGAQAGATYHGTMAKFIEKHVASWSLSEAGVKCIAKNIAKLRAPLIEKLFSIIVGELASDPTPESEEAPQTVDDQDAADLGN